MGQYWFNGKAGYSMNKKSLSFSRIMILAAVLLMLAGLTFSAEAETSANLAADYTGKTVILQSNDVHGALDGYQYMAGLKDELEKRGADVILVDSGDYLQGSVYVADNKGKAAVEMMNACGYDIITLGNHEFDYDTLRLVRTLGKLNAEVVVSNLIDTRAKEPVFDSSYLYEGADSDLKIGFYGEVTSDTKTKSFPGNLQGVEILGREEMYSAARKDIDELEAQGADIIIALTHLGVEDDVPDMSYDLYKNTKGAVGTGTEPLSDDELRSRYMLLDAHSHTVMVKGTDDEPIMSTGTKFMNIGVVVIDEKTEKIEKNFLYQLREENKDTAKYRSDIYSNKEVAEEGDRIIAEVDRKYGEKIGETKVDLNGEKGSFSKETGEKVSGNRNGETNLGDILTDAFRWYVLERGESLKTDPDKTVAIENGGAVRTSISKGDITRKDILRLHPFGNTICVIYIRGSKLLEALEAATASLPENSGGFPQLSGMDIVIDEAAKYDALEQPYPESTYYGPASINRVTIKSVNGKPFDKNETYAVITNNFIAAGGDQYYAFKSSGIITDTGMTDEYVVAQYIKEGLNGVVGEEYAEPQGRIKIVSKSDQSIKVSANSLKNRTVRESALKGSAKSVSAVRVSGAKTRLTYKKLSGSKKLSINKKTGKIKVKKGTGKGTYSIKLRVRAAGSDDYRKAEKTLTVKIRVK